MAGRHRSGADRSCTDDYGKRRLSVTIGNGETLLRSSLNPTHVLIREVRPIEPVGDRGSAGAYAIPGFLHQLLLVPQLGRVGSVTHVRGVRGLRADLVARPKRGAVTHMARLLELGKRIGRGLRQGWPGTHGQDHRGNDNENRNTHVNLSSEAGEGIEVTFPCFVRCA